MTTGRINQGSRFYNRRVRRARTPASRRGADCGLSARAPVRVRPSAGPPIGRADAEGDRTAATTAVPACDRPRFVVNF